MKSKLKPCDGPCKSLKVIWKNYEGEKFCSDCWNRYGLQFKKSKPKTTFKQRAIKLKSTIQAKLDIAYGVLRNKYLRDHPMCQAHLPGCALKSSEVHHTRGRGEYFLNTATWLATCRPCHSWVEVHPIEAKELGFSESRLETINTEDDGC